MNIEEKAQGSFEYLLILAAVLIVLASVILMIQTTSAGLETTVGNRIGNTVSVVENILTFG